MTLTAAEAKHLTKESLKGPVIERYVTIIDVRIKEAAKAGKSSIHSPEVRQEAGDTSNNFIIGGDEQEAVKKHYTDKGYSWVDHVDPDPGHPGSKAYTTLEW